MQLHMTAALAAMRLSAAALVLALLAACQTPPAPAAAPPPAATGLSQEQQDVLRSLGFTEDDAGWTLITPGRLLFATDSDALRPELHAKVDAVARSLHQVGIDRFRVEGHTDNQGAAAYNDALSLRRANAVAQVMIDAGIPAAQVVAVGYGFSRPLKKNDSDAARSENRRVAIVVPVP